MKRTRLPAGDGYRILGGSISGRILSIGTGLYLDTIAQGATIEDSELRIVRVGRASLDYDATFVRCDIVARRPIHDRQFIHSRFVDCAFRGEFSGCRFGRFLPDSTGYLDKCDLSGARLDLSDFYECDHSSLRLPGWPHFYLLWDGVEAWKQQWLSLPFPPELKVTAEVLVKYPRSNSFVSVYLPSHGLEPETVWPIIQGFPAVWFPGIESRTPARRDAVETQTATNLERQRERDASNRRAAVWNNLHNGWLVGLEQSGSAEWRALIDSSFLRKRISCAPSALTVTLHGCKRVSLLREGQEQAIPVTWQRFMILSASDTPRGVLLKGHRKQLGWPLLNYEDYSIHDDSGSPLAIEALDSLAQAYWASE